MKCESCPGYGCPRCGGAGEILEKLKPTVEIDGKTFILEPWKPEQDQLRLALLGKLLEELNECGAIAARCLIQGIDGREPRTDKPNRLALQEEIADVLATTHLVQLHFELDKAETLRRAARKMQHLSMWHAKLPL